MIDIGDRIRIKDNLLSELQRIGKSHDGVDRFVNKWVGKIVKVAYVYCDAPLICDDVVIIDGSNEWFVKINNYVEFPIEACEIVEKLKKGDRYGIYDSFANLCSSD